MNKIKKRGMLLQRTYTSLRFFEQSTITQWKNSVNITL